MRALLLEVPQSAADWERWSVHHRQDHDLIRQAIQQQGGPNLPQYPLDPIALDQPQQFLAWNQEAHSEMNGVLRAQGSDLEDVDFNDRRQMEAWIFLHYQEHLTAGDRLGVG